MNLTRSLQKAAFAIDQIPYTPGTTPISIAYSEGQVFKNYLLIPRMLPLKVEVPVTVTGYDETAIRNFYAQTCGETVTDPGAFTHFTCTRSNMILAAIAVSNDQLVHNLTIAPTKASVTRRWISWPGSAKTQPAKKILPVRYFGYMPAQETTLMALMEHALHHAWENNYDFMSILVNEKEQALNQILSTWKRK